MNCELPDVQAAFRKGRGTRDQIAKILCIIGKARDFQKNMHLCFTDYMKVLTAWITIHHGKFLELGIPDHLTCLQRNLYAPQEATVRTRNGTTDWLQIGKGVRQSVYFHPAYSTCEMQGWMKHKLESRLLEELSIMSDMQMTPSLWQKTKN